MARDKGNALVIAGSKTAQALNGELVEEDEDGDTGVSNNLDRKDEPLEDDNDKAGRGVTAIVSNSDSISVNVDGKRRLSKAERRKMKKNPSYKLSVADENGKTNKSPFDADLTMALSKKSKCKRGTDFRDNTHFIENDSNPDNAAAARSRQIEAAMQPSAASTSKGVTSLAYRIEESMLDIVGDENIDLVKRQRMMRWDKSKRKYVQTTVGDELSGESKSKKMRLESGQLVKSEKLKLGELYEKWQKKTNRSVGRVGVFDDVTDDAGVDVRDVSPKVGKNNGNNNNGKNGGDTKKTAVAIRKEREKKENLRIKNMKKADRRQLERKQRSEKTAADGSRKKGFQGKKGTSGRWKKKSGKR